MLPRALPGRIEPADVTRRILSGESASGLSQPFATSSSPGVAAPPMVPARSTELAPDVNAASTSARARPKPQSLSPPMKAAATSQPIRSGAPTWSRVQSDIDAWKMARVIGQRFSRSSPSRCPSRYSASSSFIGAPSSRQRPSDGHRGGFPILLFSRHESRTRHMSLSRKRSVREPGGRRNGIFYFRTPSRTNHRRLTQSRADAS